MTLPALPPETPEFWSSPKPDLEACVCGCGVIGRPRKKQWTDGLGPHVRGCTCRRCVGSRQSGKARKREHRAARAIGGTRQAGSGNLSGFDLGAGLWVIEETANKSLVRGLFSWYDGKGTQDKLARINSLNGVKKVYLCWDGRRALAVMDWEDLAPAIKEEVEGA